MAEKPSGKAPTAAGGSDRSQRGLDWLNFFVADVETAFGPFIAIYLSRHGWQQGEIGTVLTLNTVIALVTGPPAGALVDWTRKKRLLIGICVVMIAAGAMIIGLFPRHLTVMAGEVLHGLTGEVLRTGLAALGLGMVGHRAFHTRVGRNHRYDALGNALTGAVMGVLGGLLSPRAPFFAAAALCLPALVALHAIRGSDINYERARSSEGRREPRPARWHEFLQNYRLLIFAGCLFLFQFANASMLPLASERLNHNFEYESEFVLAALVVVPQLITAGLAAWVARKADEWGRKKLLILGFGALVPRALLFAVAPGPWFLAGVQVLGGFTAIIIGIMTPLVVADVTRKSGRYNFALGATGMAAALGAAVSTTAVGFVAQEFGFTTGFLTLAVVAGGAVAILWLFMPETSYEARRED